MKPPQTEPGPETLNRLHLYARAHAHPFPLDSYPLKRYTGHLEVLCLRCTSAAEHNNLQEVLVFTVGVVLLGVEFSYLQSVEVLGDSFAL